MTSLAGSLIVAGALLAAPSAALGFEVRDADAAPASGGPPGLWFNLRAVGASFGGPDAGASLAPKSAFDSIVVGLDSGLDARMMSSSDIAPIGQIRARVGYAFDRFVAYGTAGAAFASTEFMRTGEAGRAAVVGWSVGAGLEATLIGGVGAKLEYLYVDIDRQALDGGVSVPTAGGQFRAGLNYRF